MPSSLRGVELYRRLGLHAGGQGSKKPSQPCARPLPSDLVNFLPTIAERDFGYLIETDTSKRDAGRYQPSKGFSKNLRSALSWVMIDAYEAWPSPLSDEQFAEKHDQIHRFLLSGLPQPADVFFGIQNRWAEEITPALRADVADESQCRSFLRGTSRPELKFTNAGATIARSVEEELFTKIRSTAQRLVLVTSAAGDGKSTLMYRVGQRLFDDGWRVMLKHEWSFDTQMNWPLGRDERQDTVLLVDRSEGVRGDLERLYAWIADNPSLRVVLFVREIDWKRTGRALESNRHAHVPLPRLNDDEINDLSLLLLQHEAADPPTSVDSLRERIGHCVHKTEYPHMLAAIMTACRGADFTYILSSMVQSFPNPDLLKCTALCAVSTGHDERPLYATHRMLGALFCKDGETIQDGCYRFEREQKGVSSEIIRIHGSQFDLRHPDIAEFVIYSLYDGVAPGGMIRSTTILSDDLYKIMCAVLLVLLHQEARLRKGVPERYLYEIPRSWWLSRVDVDHEVGRHLHENVCERLGNLDEDRSLQANLLRSWLHLEQSAEKKEPRAAEIQWLWFPKLIEICSHSFQAASNEQARVLRQQELYDAYVFYFEFVVRQGALGDIVDPARGSARGILREMWRWNEGRFRGVKLIEMWRKLEGFGGGLGSLKNPNPYTLRWLFREAWQNEKLAHAELLLRWTQLEEAAANVGDKDAPAEYSARWVFRRAWKEENRDRLCDAELILRWAQMEAKAENVGDKDVPAEYSARWVFRQAWEEENRGRLCNANTMNEWARMEAGEENVGDKDVPAEYSARWVFRQAWKEESRGRLCNAETPSRSLSAPSTTTVSPGVRPALTETFSPCAGPSLTGRTETVLSALTT